MKRIQFFVYIALCIGLLTGCFTNSPLPEPTELAPCTTGHATAAPTETEAPSTEQATVPVTEPVTEPAPLHSDLYIPGLSVEDVITYFNEVCLDAELEHSGDSSLLQKWTAPIQCKLNGTFTGQDLGTFMRFFVWLNNVEGFPGIKLVYEDSECNLQIHFCSQQELSVIMNQQLENVDGAVTFWYDNNNQIYEAVICYRNDLNQHLRNSVILEEIYNGLGPIQDTSLREDSIIYAEFSEPQELTEIDELILRLLYHPDMKCGMNAQECEAVIRQLYY